MELEVEPCPYLFVARGYTNWTDTRLLGVGSVLSVSCDDGYTLHGEEIVTCQRGGFWTDRPRCTSQDAGSEGGGFDTTLVIVVCGVASAVVLAVLMFAVYILLNRVKSEKELKEIEKQEKEKEDLHNLRMYMSDNPLEDSVGMPAVVYGNYNSTLRGKPINTTDGPSKDGPVVSVAEKDFQDAKAFIY